VASVYRRRGSKAFFVAFFDEHGRRREKSTGATEKRAAERIAERIRNDVALRKSGVVDPRAEAFVKANRQPLSQHIADYLAHSEHMGQAHLHIVNKRGQLRTLVKGTRATRLADLEVDKVARHLRALKASGRSARTVNCHRATIVAFGTWLVTVGRMPANRLTALPVLDEKKDRRRERRALTDEEVSWLVATTREREEAEGATGMCPRSAVYLVLSRTGWRRGEASKLTWGDLDLDGAVVTIRAAVGKASRDDRIPIHPQAVEALKALRPAHATPGDRVFGALPTPRTLYRDLAKAREAWIAEAPSRVERRLRDRTDFLRQRDSAGRIVDLHSLRRTFATTLARSGVSPQMARQLMRHADMRTTIRHCEDLELRDLAAAVRGVPGVGAGCGRTGPR